ncbi:hypothetical protein [Kitasatospora sp. NPDC004272]
MTRITDSAGALAAAEEYCRREIRTWESLDCYLVIHPEITIEGAYVVSYLARNGRLGGAFPVVVDAETGACRFVDGIAEYKELKKRSRG